MNNPYDYADEQIALLKAEINAEFQNETNLANFDELNVIQTKKSVKALYARLLSFHRMMCQRTASRAYRAAWIAAIAAGYVTSDDKTK